MTPAVPDHIGFCDIQGRTVLLDIERDRYSVLPPALEGAFRRVAAGGDQAASADDLRRLRRRGILTDGRRTRVLDVATPTSSHVEDREVPKTSPKRVLSVGCRLLAARHALRRRPFVEVAKALEHRRAVRSRSAIVGVTTDLLAAVSDFHAARRLVPITPVCLQDSLALLSYLQPLGFRPALVFGVALDPFSAHCWLQADTVVLNDALHRARSHTPILAL